MYAAGVPKTKLISKTEAAIMKLFFRAGAINRASPGKSGCEAAP